MNAGLIQRKIVETARERGFTEKHIAVMSFEIGRSLNVALLSDRQMETLLDALQREKPELESIWPENAFGLMCRCNQNPQWWGMHGPVTMWSGPELHLRGCAYLRFIDLA